MAYKTALIKTGINVAYLKNWILFSHQGMHKPEGVSGLSLTLVSLLTFHAPISFNKILQITTFSKVAGQIVTDIALQM